MIDKRNLEFANKLLEDSKDDLEASELLYNNKKKCSKAIYHLQQSAEKAIKTYFVLMGFKPADKSKDLSKDLKNFRHDPIDRNVLKGILMLFLGHTFRNQIAGYYASPIFSFILNIPIISTIPLYLISKQAEFNHKQLLKKHLPLFDDELKILKMEKGKIEYHLKYPLDSDDDYTDKRIQMRGELYLRQWNKINEIVKKDTQIQRKIDEHFLELYGKNSQEYFEECYNEIYNKIDWGIKKTQKQKYWNMIEIFSENMTRNIKWSMKIRNVKPLILIYICLITGPHLQTQSVRYPKDKEDRLEPSDYKKGLGIVDAYQEIHDKLEKCIGFIEFIKN